jgi:membrane-bound lytic murein transglycosylase A
MCTTSSLVAQTAPSQLKPSIAADAAKPAAKSSKARAQEARVELKPTSFDALPGWATDDHLAAFNAFRRSCARLIARAQKKSPEPGRSADLLASCLAAEALAARRTPDKAAARAFFEAYFTPSTVSHQGPAGFVTGYYEPQLKGSKTQGGRFQTPIYRRPADLVNVVDETQRASKQQGFTHLRKTADGLKPYFTRREIEEGALKGQGLELVWLDDPVEAFFMHVQGSARIALPDGTFMRLTYDGKNGHPYTSIGRKLIEAKVMGADSMTLGNLGQWLKADAKRGREAMWFNNSFVFFRELTGEGVDGPLGSLEIPLSAGRSLAVDTAFHSLGLPIYVSSPTLTHWQTGKKGDQGFARLMIAQDVGSAIKGPERGDLFFGAGDKAGQIAGQTKNPATFYVLVPKPQEAGGPLTSALPPKKAKP